MRNGLSLTSTKLRRTVLPALGLFFLAPLIGEFLLGNLPITWLWTLVALAPLYGGGALVIRELSRRLGIGWPGMILLCLAFGIVEEAFVTQSLFNPDYLGLSLISHAYIPWLGIGVWWTIFVIGLHAIWSTAVPIALVETLGGRPEEPWLGSVGFGIAVVVFLAGCAMTVMLQAPGFMAAPHQFLIAGLVIAMLLAAALIVDRAPSAAPVRDPETAPGPWRVALTSFFSGSAFVSLAYLRDVLPVWVSIAGMALALVACTFFLLRWSRRTGWDQRHRFAAAAGFVVTYIWFGTVQVPPVGDVPLWIDLGGNAVFSLGALVILYFGARKSAEGQGTG